MPMRDEWGFDDEVRAAARRAEQDPGYVPVRAPAVRRRSRVRTNRRTGEREIVTELAPDPVPDAVNAALSNELLGGVPIEAPAGLDAAEIARFWAMIHEHRVKVGADGR